MPVSITRLDHYGVVAGIIKDLGIIELIDSRLNADPREEISPGEAVAGMIINGLGFTSKPLSLTPKFFEGKPLDILFRPQVEASYFNRSKLGRALDEVYEYGCGKLFYEISASCCIQENIDMRFNSLDTTTLSVSGEYDSCSDEQAISITYGKSKDHRPDLKQLVHELMVSQDGGVPLLMKSWDGNASDNTIFMERSNELIDKFKDSEAPRYLIADSKLYTKKNAENLSKLNFITRVPHSNKAEIDFIDKAFNTNNWTKLDSENQYYSENVQHIDINQRWITVNSSSANSRAKKQIEKALKEEKMLINKQNKNFTSKPFCCIDDARRISAELSKKIKYHFYKDMIVEKQNSDVEIKYILQITLEKNEELISEVIRHKSCYTIATNISEIELSNEDVIKAYKNQNNSVENTAFRFLKDPVFFTSSLFLKKETRIEGLLTIMTLSLLVYSIAQRRARAKLKENNETVPNQINKPIQNPTARWLFQILDGINIVKIKINETVNTVVEGMNELKDKVINLFGDTVAGLYQKFQKSVGFVT